MTDALTKYQECVQTWKETPFDKLNQTAELMKDFAIVLSDLTMHKIDFKKRWNAHVYRITSAQEKKNISAAERDADFSIPELQELREVIRAGTNILDAIRSQVSLLKQEQ